MATKSNQKVPELASVGIDIGKDVFHVVGFDLDGKIVLRRPPPGLIHHSDRGSQYCSDDYQRLLKAQDMLPSMSGKGNCYDCDYVAAA